MYSMWPTYHSKHIVYITTWQCTWYTYLILIYDAQYSCCISIDHAHLHDKYLMHAYMFSIYDIWYSILVAINTLQVYTIRLLACSYMLAYNQCTMHSMHCINVCYVMSMIDDVHPTVLYCIVAIRCMLSVSVTNSLYYQ